MTTAVSEHALIKRINRKLAHDGKKIKTARSLRVERDPGRYFVVDVHHNLVVDRDVQLKGWAASLGCWRARDCRERLRRGASLGHRGGFRRKPVGRAAADAAQEGRQ
jgi:hypothetical protein